jgi:hypothetical protein
MSKETTIKPANPSPGTKGTPTTIPPKPSTGTPVTNPPKK